jgi:hypothetical protein
MEENPYRSPLKYGGTDDFAAQTDADENRLATGFRRLLWMGVAVFGTLTVMFGAGLALSTLEEFARPKPNAWILAMIPVGSALFCLGIYILKQASKRLDFRVDTAASATQKEEAQ